MTAREPSVDANALDAAEQLNPFDAARISSVSYLYPANPAHPPTFTSLAPEPPRAGVPPAPDRSAGFLHRWRRATRREPESEQVRDPISENIRAERRRSIRRIAVPGVLVLIAVAALAVVLAGVVEWWSLATFMVSFFAYRVYMATDEFRRRPPSMRPPGERRRRVAQRREAERRRRELKEGPSAKW
ncbi:MAG: hypothetical protein ABWX65_00615 [Mycetocola sp.]